MIATRRGLVILAAIAGALLALLIVDLARTSPSTDRALVPGFDEASVTRIGWTAHPVGPYLTLERTTDGPWRRTSPAPGAVEQTPVASLLAAVRGARWHRSEERALRDGATHVAIDHARGRLELWVGLADATTGQGWIGIGDHRYLVDGWVTRALVPSPLELAIRTPLAGIANVPEYTIEGVRIDSWPRRIGVHVLDPAFVGDLERALAELAIEALPPAPPAPMAHGEAITIEMVGTRVSLDGPCETRVYLAATTGDGCVARDRADAVRVLVEKLKGPRAALVARAPIPVGIHRVLLAGGGVLDLERRATIDGDDASPEAVAALMTVLRSPVDAADVVQAPTTRPMGVLAIANERGNDMALFLHPGNLVARADESFALRLAPEAFAVLLRGPSSYKDPTPWREEPTTITEIRIDNVIYKRGAVIGEWVRSPAGPSDAASIDALVTALAAPRVLGVAPTTVVAKRRIELVVQPPVGNTKSHMLELGTATAAGCPAKIGSSSVLLSVEICRHVPR